MDSLQKRLVKGKRLHIVKKKDTPVAVDVFRSRIFEMLWDGSFSPVVPVFVDE